MFLEIGLSLDVVIHGTTVSWFVNSVSLPLVGILSSPRISFFICDIDIDKS